MSKDWHLTEDQRTWEYRPGGVLVNSVMWNNVRFCYEDREGHGLGLEFSSAIAKVESGAPRPAEAQQRLSL